MDRRLSPNVTVDPATGKAQPTDAARKVAAIWTDRWTPTIDAALAAGVTLPCPHTDDDSHCGDCPVHAPHGPGRCEETCEPFCTALRSISDEVITDNYGLAVASSRKFRRGPHADIMDAVAADAFYRAWLYFDPSKGSFGTHVRRWVTGACQEALHRAKFPHLSDRAFEKRIPIRDEIARRRHDGESLDVDEIAAAVGASVAVVEQHLQPISTVSMDATLGSEDGTTRTWGDLVADETAVTDGGIDSEVLAEAGRALVASADLPDVALYSAVALTGVGGGDPVRPALLRRTVGADVADRATLRRLKDQLATTDVDAFDGSLADFIAAVGDVETDEVADVAWKALLAT